MTRCNKVFASVKQISLPVHGDSRGSLVALEKGSGVPFEIRRVYYIFGTQKGQERGFHAHKRLIQLLIATSGSCSVKCIYGTKEQVFVLNKPTEGLLIDGFVWREMFDFSNDCVLMVLASEYYDEADYIRNYHDFQRENGQ